MPHRRFPPPLTPAPPLCPRDPHHCDLISKSCCWPGAMAKFGPLMAAASQERGWGSHTRGIWNPRVGGQPPIPCTMGTPPPTMPLAPNCCCPCGVCNINGLHRSPSLSNSPVHSGPLCGIVLNACCWWPGTFKVSALPRAFPLLGRRYGQRLKPSRRQTCLSVVSDTPSALAASGCGMPNMVRILFSSTLAAGRPCLDVRR